jgi:hypothetical protein
LNAADPKELDVLLDDVADEVIVSGLAEELASLLHQLVKRIEARLSRK